MAGGEEGLEALIIAPEAVLAASPVIPPSKAGEPLAAPKSVPEPSLPQLQQELERIEWTRRITLGLLIVPVGWVVLSPTFTGAPLDYLIAFAWAFLTDLTTQSLVTAWQPLKDKARLPG